MFVCLKMTAYAYAMPSDVLKKTAQLMAGFFVHAQICAHEER